MILKVHINEIKLNLNKNDEFNHNNHQKKNTNDYWPQFFMHKNSI